MFIIMFIKYVQSDTISLNKVKNGRDGMATAINRREDLIRVKQYITDTKGHKVAAVIEIEELIRLKAMADIIPSSEAWLYKNKEALESVSRGLKDAAKGRISKLNIDEL